MVCRRTARGWVLRNGPPYTGRHAQAEEFLRSSPNAHSAHLRAPPRERGHALNPKLEARAERALCTGRACAVS